MLRAGAPWPARRAGLDPSPSRSDWGSFTGAVLLMPAVTACGKLFRRRNRRTSGAKPLSADPPGWRCRCGSPPSRRKDGVAGDCGLPLASAVFPVLAGAGAVVVPLSPTAWPPRREYFQLARHAFLPCGGRPKHCAARHQGHGFRGRAVHRGDSFRFPILNLATPAVWCRPYGAQCNKKA